MKKLLIVFILFTSFSFSQQFAFRLAVLKYSGGGDYYANPSSLPNLIKFCNKNLNTVINPDVPYVEAGSKDILQYPFVHMTGHGNVVFSPQELDNLRTYMLAGGFLHIDDNYGMDAYIRPQIKKLFPDQELVEIPTNHPIFHQKYDFTTLPKIHEHDNKPPKAYGVFIEGKLVLLYTFETDLGDGWENQAVHNDPNDKRTQALQMGANILMYVFSR
jgi:hypothetical protein